MFCDSYLILHSLKQFWIGLSATLNYACKILNVKIFLALFKKNPHIELTSTRTVAATFMAIRIMHGYGIYWL